MAHAKYLIAETSLVRTQLTANIYPRQYSGVGHSASHLKTVSCSEKSIAPDGLVRRSNQSPNSGRGGEGRGGEGRAK